MLKSDVVCAECDKLSLLKNYLADLIDVKQVMVFLN